VSEGMCCESLFEFPGQIGVNLTSGYWSAHSPQVTRPLSSLHMSGTDWRLEK
jgi:hypothetical protein